MKPSLAAIAIVLLATLVPAAARAQSDAEYKNSMKQADKTNDKLRKELKAKSADAADDANKIADLFAQLGQFWQQRNAGDGVKFAADAASGYKQVADLASAGKFDEASAELKSSEANCSGCHKVHRSMTIHGAESSSATKFTLAPPKHLSLAIHLSVAKDLSAHCAARLA